MPLIESQPDALANVYARSLLELAEEQGGQERIESVLGQLEDLLEMARADKTFGEFLASRVLTTVGRAASLRRILDGRVDDLVLRFLLVLNEKGRLGHIAAIVAAYDAQHNTQLVQSLKTERTGILGEYTAIDPSKRAALAGDEKAAVDAADRESKHDALRTIAYLPVIMFLVYLGLILYFRSRGGYKPVVLDLKK